MTSRANAADAALLQVGLVADTKLAGVQGALSTLNPGQLLGNGF